MIDGAPVWAATHLSASLYLDSAERPFPDIDVVSRLRAATDGPDVAVRWTGELFDALCDAYDADILGVSLPRPAAWTVHEDGLVALIGFELLPILGDDPVARLSEMFARIAAALPAGLTVTVPRIDD